VVQLYVRDVESSVYRPAKELKAFAKVQLGVGESRTVELSLDRRAFAVWDVASRGWAVEAGEFEVLGGASSVDIRARASVTVDSADAVATSAGPAHFVATDAEFEAMLGRPIPVAAKTLPFTLETTIRDLRQSLLGKVLATMFVAQSRKA